MLNIDARNPNAITAFSSPESIEQSVRTSTPLTFGIQDIVRSARSTCVSAVNHDSEGEIYTADFGGPLARERVEEYAAWKRSGGGMDITVETERLVARLAAQNAT